VGETNGGSKQSPGVEESPAIGKIRTNHDESLDAEQGGTVEKGGHPETLHRRRD
jgi:hypothetical protein